MQNELTPGAYEFMLARTVFFDQIVARALRDDLAQIVLLGAGYDSRPYRFSGLIRDTRIFELDAPLTQQRKLECLRQAAIALSPQICFVQINFETDSLGEALCAADFQREDHTLFIWEGVSYYLSRKAVDQTLAAVSAISPAGSLIAFDYAAISPTTLSDPGVQQFRKMMRTRHAGEPAGFGIPTGQIETFLNQRGFQLLDHLTAAEMNEKYLASEHDAANGGVPPLFCLALAEVR